MSNAKGKTTRALVIAGGGAKGAYAFGCLKAFKKRGVKFDVVSGTSVGALNATLWSTDSLEEGEVIWSTLSFDSIYPVEFLDASSYPKTFVRLAAYTFVLIRMLWDCLHRIPLPGITAPFKMAILTIAYAPVFVTWLTCAAAGEWRQLTGWAIITAPMLLLAYVTLIRGRSQSIVIFLAFAYASWVLPIFGFALVGMGVSLEALRSSLVVRGIELLIGIFLLAGFIFVPMLAGFWIHDRLQGLLAEDWTVLQSSPLKRRVKEILDRSEPLVPTWVTAAQLADIFDPDDPHWFTHDVDAKGLPIPGARYYPDLVREWVPRYIDLRTLSLDDAVSFCLASAALPFGIVPPIEIEGVSYVDGGVVDNVPVGPVSDPEHVDEVWVILLEPLKKRQIAQLSAPDEWVKKRRLQDLLQHPIPGPFSNDSLPFRARNDPPIIVPYCDVDSFPRFVFFAPEKRLGGFLSGTLNFDAEYANEIMQKGEFEASVRLDRLSIG